MSSSKQRSTKRPGDPLNNASIKRKRNTTRPKTIAFIDLTVDDSSSGDDSPPCVDARASPTVHADLEIVDFALNGPSEDCVQEGNKLQGHRTQDEPTFLASSAPLPQDCVQGEDRLLEQRAPDELTSSEDDTLNDLNRDQTEAFGLLSDASDVEHVPSSGAL